jgi:hypothetical protein
MPMYDRRCNKCEKVSLDCWEPIDTPDMSCECTGTLERVYLPTNRGQVIGDEIDVTIKHALCWPNGEPRRFRSRTELKKAEQAAGYTNYVVHQGTKHGDRSKHTTKWT